MKPKTNRAGDEHKSSKYDRCQTPPYAVEPLLPYIPKEWTIWECAAGDNFLANAMIAKGYNVIASDILTGDDFFTSKKYKMADVIITNPPYSVKYSWIKRCYEIGLPWALLMPVETIGAKSAQTYFSKHGVNLMIPDKRIDFGMPNKGWSGHGAQFPTMWFTWNIPGIKPIHFVKIRKYDMRQVIMF